ncbi:D-2-hydroxyacid dehydrogenase [Ammoniphilus resinae]|uniref:Glyoxylate/hydroxypyruvate reductase A n=1 Tax=Ammoniphilus resinae TaxID=861532 RepID=A0ABS4GMH6_9BACL|nr:D-2-hydroxyacid dehydrogenase [Ammoniphilus resinae]MBP1931267.1 glyoxylate/hydroxypyruvate reductase A [Ammoniphilus resinae]
MHSPKILVYRPDEVEYYKEIIEKQGITNIYTASTLEEAKSQLPTTEVILCWQFPLELLETPEASSVKWIQSMGAGVDDLVKHPSIPNDIQITRIVDQFGTPISEFVFGYMLYLANDIARTREEQAKRQWTPFHAQLLSGKKIGVAGLGSVGLEIVRKARAFDMEVFGLSMSGAKADRVDHHFGPDQWKSFVQELDYLVLTLPLTEQTRWSVNREVLLSMKPDATLINVGRGALVKESDLIEILQEGHLKAVVLDVFEKEPLPIQHPFWTMPNVLVTPHLSGPSTPEGVGQFFVQNLQKYVEGKPLQGVVRREFGY